MKLGAATVGAVLLLTRAVETNCPALTHVFGFRFAVRIMKGYVHGVVLARSQANFLALRRVSRRELCTRGEREIWDSCRFMNS